MININLLDWRAKKILILNRRFAAVIIACILAWLLVAAFIYLIIQLQIARAKDDVAFMDTQLNSVASIVVKIKALQAQKNQLLTKRKTIEDLQASRPLVVNIFDNLVRALPPGVVLDSLARKSDEIIFSGTGDSNYSISVLMENVQRLPWVKKAKLSQLSNQQITGSVTPAADETTSGQVNFALTLTIDTQKEGVVDATTRN